MITDITGPVGMHYKDYLLSLGQSSESEKKALREKIAEKLSLKIGSSQDILEITSLGKDPEMNNPALERITRRIKYAGLNINTKKRLVQYAWNALKTAKADDEDFQSKFEKSFYQLIQALEFQEKYRLSLEMIRKHIKEINMQIKNLVERDKKEKMLQDTISKLAEKMKESGESEKGQKEDLQQRIKSVLSDKGDELASRETDKKVDTA
ncbi:MAG: hypothetical protein JW928_06475 [Candidatus Aureabacteria bacterium]|nr:hypothetical protein [Candidatus Auribacterota bacterium]